MPSERMQTAIDKIKAAEQGFVIELDSELIEEDDEGCLIKAIKEVQAPLIILYLRIDKIGWASLESLDKAIEERAGALLALKFCSTGTRCGSTLLTKAIKKRYNPLILDLSWNSIGRDADFKFLVKTIKEVQVPLQLDFITSNPIEGHCAKFLVAATSASRVPLALDFHDKNIGDANIALFTQLIKEARAPLTLGLPTKHITKAGADVLVESIKESSIPLTLNFGYGGIGYGDFILTEAIKGARFPLALDLVSDIGIVLKALTTTIKHALVPLTLNLYNNGIGDAGVESIAKAIREARVPLIILDLCVKSIWYGSLKSLAEAIKETRVPLTLTYDCGDDPTGIIKYISDAKKDNFAIDAGEDPSKFFANLKFNLFSLLGLKPILEQTPEVKELIGLGYLKDIAIIIQEYALDTEYLAWKAVAAIRAVEGASRENKYASINDTLLTAKYSASQVQIVQTLNAAAIEHEEAGDNSKSRDYYEQALDMCKVLYPCNHPEIAYYIYKVGVAYQSLGVAYQNSGNSGDNKKALDCFEQALNMRQALHKGNHLDVAASLYAVGYTYGVSGDNVRARYYCGQSLDMCKALYPGHNPEVAYYLHKVGVVYQSLGDNRKALDYFGQALNMHRVLYQDNHPDVAVSLNNMGVAYQSLGDNRKALDYFEQALNMRQALHKGNHPDVAASLYAVGYTYGVSGDNGRACYYYEQANSMKQALGRQLQKEDEFKGQGISSYTGDGCLEYYNSGIDRMLKLRLYGVTNAIALKSRYFGGDIRHEAWRMAYDICAILAGGSEVVLAPVNLYNKHWLGLLFRNLDGIVEVTYMDSEQRAMPLQLREELGYSFSMNNYQSRFSEAKLTLQRYNNCGFELLENFAYYLTGTRATQEGAVYMHSLLVENSLLDQKEYGLKIAENKKLIGLLSNSESTDIRSIGTSNLLQRPFKASEDPFIKHGGDSSRKDDNGGEADIINLYQTSAWFKALDLVVDSARLVREPTIAQAKKLALDYAYLKGMAFGVNYYSVMIGGAETMYRLHLGEYMAAFNVAAGTMSAIALPVILAMANRPYLVAAYGAYMATSTAYNAITNAYSFATELGSSDVALKSAMAYKDLAEWMAASPLQALHDFGTKAKEYKLQINDLLFEKEKSIVQTQMKGEFEQKVFDYIYLPELLEKYALLNDVIRGELTEEEAKILKSKPVAISYGELEYDHCVRIEDSKDEAAEHYYCCNIVRQILDHVVLTGSGDLEVFESL